MRVTKCNFFGFPSGLLSGADDSFRFSMASVTPVVVCFAVSPNCSAAPRMLKYFFRFVHDTILSIRFLKLSISWGLTTRHHNARKKRYRERKRASFMTNFVPITEAAEPRASASGLSMEHVLHSSHNAS